MFDPVKRKVSLEEYLAETKQPKESFTEDNDYIIHDNDSKLKIYINKNIYYKTTFGEHPRFGYLMPHTVIRLFDITKVKYQPPYMPAGTDIEMLLGQYFIGEKGPSFYITEPKNATHALFYNLPVFPFYYRVDTSSNKNDLTAHVYSDDTHRIMPLESVFAWLGKIMYITESQLNWEKNRFMCKYQVQFYDNLSNFYECQA